MNAVGFFFSFRNINTVLSYGTGRQECNGGGVVFGLLFLEWPWFSILWESINRPRGGNWGHKPRQAAEMLLKQREQDWAHTSSSLHAHMHKLTRNNTRFQQPLMTYVKFCWYYDLVSFQKQRNGRSTINKRRADFLFESALFFRTLF